MNIKKYERRKRREEIRKAEKEYSKEEKTKKREKYGSKTGANKFFHKYTGIIVVLTALLVVFIAWLYHDSTLDEFEKFTCSEVLRYTGVDGLTDDQLVKWNDILAECEGKFTPP